MAGILGGILGGDNSGGDDQQQSNNQDSSVLDNATNILDLNASNSSYDQDDDGSVSSRDSSLSLDNGTSLDNLVDNMTNDQSSST